MFCIQIDYLLFIQFTCTLRMTFCYIVIWLCSVPAITVAWGVIFSSWSMVHAWSKLHVNSANYSNMTMKVTVVLIPSFCHSFHMSQSQLGVFIPLGCGHFARRYVESLLSRTTSLVRIWFNKCNSCTVQILWQLSGRQKEEIKYRRQGIKSWSFGHKHLELVVLTLKESTWILWSGFCDGKLTNELE